MRAPLSWLREHVPLPATVTGRDVAQRLISAGLEVETVDDLGADVTGPLVVGRVLSIAEESHSNGKKIRWCRVDVGVDHNEPAAELPAGRSIVCGASNFDVNDLVVVSLPGAVLPGGFEISARKTYGHVSDGMICSARELAIDDDHLGIIVLPAEAGEPGADAIALLGLRDSVLDIAVTPDRGYCLSIRGIARETATAFQLPFADPADLAVSQHVDNDWLVQLDDADGCDRFVAQTVFDFDTAASTPLWMQRRLQMCGMRPISLAVDITNYVMLELGQPLHAYDRTSLTGTIVVRSAVEGERITTLDGANRELRTDDLLITDDTGAIGIAGVMGGASTEITDVTTDIVIEAAHFAPTRIARTARRHKLPSEASRRFERGVDTALQEVAAARAAGLLASLGGARVPATRTVVDKTRATPVVHLDLNAPTRIVGHHYNDADVVAALTNIGAQLDVNDRRATVTPPSWRPDLRSQEDLVEEVARLNGYDVIPSVLPKAPSGMGYTDAQRIRRRVGLSLAGAGFVEVAAYPFVSGDVGDLLLWDHDDARRNAVRLANPLREEEPFLRTSLLPGLLQTLRRNIGRGLDDVALFESGLVFRPGPPVPPPTVGVEQRPSADQIAALNAVLPAQPRHVATAAAGLRAAAGWWGRGVEVSWADAVESARVIARAAGVELAVFPAAIAPWHPGRCAALRVADLVVGHAGELHPRVISALGLPLRTVAMELDLDELTRLTAGPTPAPTVATFPVAKADLAFVVPAHVSAAAVSAAVTEGVAEIDPMVLESVQVFDVYQGEQVPDGHKSLAFALRFRASDRTLTVAEVASLRAAAIDRAAERLGAVLRD